MTQLRSISKEQVHARAVRMGRSRGFKAEAGRLAASDPGRVIDELVKRLKPEAWALSDGEIIEALAGRLWLDWITVEYRVALAAGAA